MTGSSILPMGSQLNKMVIWEVSNLEQNILFDDYLAEQLKDPDFKAGFDSESTKLENEVALMNEQSLQTKRNSN